MGIPWWSSGLDSALSLQGPGVQSLVGELRSHKPQGVAKIKYFFKNFKSKQDNIVKNRVCQVVINAMEKIKQRRRVRRGSLQLKEGGQGRRHKGDI